ncbi:MAG: hypothetical protein LBC53_06710 [Spirochaetaceae bacterium]|jgi:hypothetical protein|nr:hypothetical protein [Spirochaetaceae bacterium]
MKKLFFCVATLLFSAGAGFAAPLDDAFKALDENFKKYPFAHLISLNKYEDDRSPRNPIKQFQRMPYDSEMLDEDGEPLKGEVLYLTVIKGGFRYELKVDFLPFKEKKAADIKTARSQILKLFRDIPEFYPASTQSAAATPAEGSAN